MLHFWCKGAAPLVPGCCTFTGTIIRKSLQWLFWRSSNFVSTLYNSSSAKPTILHWLSLRPPNVVSSFFILIAAWRSVSLRLQSLNQKTLTEYHRFFFGVFSRIRFLIFFWHGLYLDRTNGILDGFVYWFCLHIKWFVWGRLVFNLIYANVFFEH